MSIESKLDRLAIDVRNLGINSHNNSPLHAKNMSSSSKASNATASTSSSRMSRPEVADSWEDELTLSDTEDTALSSGHSTPIEGPGPTHLKSPASKAIDAIREAEGPNGQNMPEPPPPTPISPTMLNASSPPQFSPFSPHNHSHLQHHTLYPSSASSSSTPRSSNTPILGAQTPRYPTPNPPVDSTALGSSERKRPEKTTATANRLIAGALGIKAPPKTEEQRRYERAVKEAEIKKRNREKEAKEREKAEDEKAKNAVWDA